MNPRSGGRKWIKLWVEPWLDGTTRFEMSDVQRAFWVDLLAMAGRSRFPGVICAGEVDGQMVGYPLNKFQALMSGPIDVLATLQLFQKTDKIELQQTHTEPVPLFMAKVLNWEKYQSEYQRQKPYRLNKIRNGLQKGDAISDTASYIKGNTTEVEVRSRSEKEKKEESLKDLPLLGYTSSPAQPENPKAFSSSSESPTSKPNGKPTPQEQIQQAEKQLQDAQREMEKNPKSAGAKRAVDEAIGALRRIAAENPNSPAVSAALDGMLKKEVRKLAGQKAMP